MNGLKRQINKKQIGIWIISLIPLLVVAAVYGRLPSQIPTNWGFDDRVSYGPKSRIWIIAGMAPFLGVLFFFLPWIDPKRQNYHKFSGVYQSFQLFMQIFLLSITGIIVTESLRPGTVHVSTVVMAMCGVLFMMMGAMLPKFRQNFFCGFKTPWTLSSEAVWDKTHQLGGKLFFAAGVIGVAGAFLPDDRWKLWFLLVPVLAASLIPCIMSYVWFQKTEG